MSLIDSVSLAPCVVMERNDFNRQPVSADLRSAQIAHYPRAMMICANSSNAQRQLERYFPSTPVAFFPNRYSSQCQPVSHGVQRTILVVGRLQTQKDPLGVLGAFYSSGLWQKDWSLVFVGSDTLEAALIDRSEQLRVSNSVRFTGQVRRGEIPYHSGSFLILNSFYEGSPNVLAECIAAGTVPLVRSSVVEAREFVPEGARGRLFYQDVKELSQRLASLNQLPDEYFALAEMLQGAYLKRVGQYRSQRGSVLSLLQHIVDSGMALDGPQTSETPRLSSILRHANASALGDTP